VINPPLIALVSGAILSHVPGLSEAAKGDPSSWMVLRMLFSAMNFVGQILSPLAMILLGAFIASSSMAGIIKFRHVMPIIGIRLMAVPAIILLLLSMDYLKLPALASVILMLEAAAPPATNHSIIARRYDGKWELVSSLQLVVHAVALITLPLWLSVALHLYGD